mgnify:FL=1
MGLVSSLNETLEPYPTYINHVYDSSYTLIQFSHVSLGINDLILEGTLKNKMDLSEVPFKLKSNNHDGIFELDVGNETYIGQGILQLYFFSESGSQISQSVVGVPSDQKKTATFSVFFEARDSKLQKKRISGSFNGRIDFIQNNVISDSSASLKYLKYVEVETQNREVMKDLQWSIYHHDQKISSLEIWQQNVTQSSGSSGGGGGGGSATYNMTNITQRISALESWKQTVSDTITSILNSLTGHTTKIDNYESRISTLENKTPIITNGTLPNYFKYLSSTDRKNIICGYAQDNRLTSINDLGWNCNITYKTYRGKVTSTCKCKEIK